MKEIRRKKKKVLEPLLLWSASCECEDCTSVWEVEEGDLRRYYGKDEETGMHRDYVAFRCLECDAYTAVCIPFEVKQRLISEKALSEEKRPKGKKKEEAG